LTTCKTSRPSSPVTHAYCKRTPGVSLETRLNREYGPGSKLYEDMSKYVREGIKEGWAANVELDGPNYRRSKICLPSPENRFFSITTVYMNSVEEYSGYFRLHWPDLSSRVIHCAHEGLRSTRLAVIKYLLICFSQFSQYHVHPYGEINCVVQIDESAELKGMKGWQGAGWTSPGPGTHHYPQVRGGALVALFFLPAGRISYNIIPGLPQPLSM
jgi:hypothetical protein